MTDPTDRELAIANEWLTTARHVAKRFDNDESRLLRLVPSLAELIHEARAEGADTILRMMVETPGKLNDSLRAALSHHLNAARAEGRRAAFEEAARIAEYSINDERLRVKVAARIREGHTQHVNLAAKEQP